MHLSAGNVDLVAAFPNLPSSAGRVSVDQTPEPARKTVLLIGAGLAGTATAIRLLRFATSPLDVVLLEKTPAHRCGGIAYFAEGNSWRHIFNIQAGRMSVFREDVDDFLRWANEEADRTDWHPDWSHVRFQESDPAPRRIYQQYMQDRLWAAVHEAAPGVRLLQPTGEAVDIDEQNGHALVTIRNYQPDNHSPVQEQHLLTAHHVVLGTGTEMKTHTFAARVQDHPAYVHNPYTKEGLATLNATPVGDTVVIIGSILTAYDAAIQLLGNGHQGKIIMVSRSGNMLSTYPANHQHAVVALRRPPFLDEPYQGKEQLIRHVLAEWQHAQEQVAREHPRLAPEVVSERIIKAWEPFVVELARLMPGEDIRSLLDEYGSLIATHRVSAMAHATTVVEQAMTGPDPQIQLVTGRVVDIAPLTENRLAVQIADCAGGQTIEACLVVSNLPRQANYAKVRSSLWQNLIDRRGLAMPHRLTGRGVEVGPQGELMRADGSLSHLLSVVGIPREGDEMVRNGRTGAFAFNVATIKNHSVGVAAHVLQLLETEVARFTSENGPDVPNTDVPTTFVELKALLASTLPGASTAGFDHLVELIHSMIDCKTMLLSAAVRRAKEQIQAEFAAAWQRLRWMLHAAEPDEAGLSALERTIDAFILTSALQRLTDVSVTPRQLRISLGLGAPRYVG